LGSVSSTRSPVTARRCFCCTAFPDTGRLWRNQVPALAGAGFQVIVPELRGYGRSDKPEAVDAYSLPVLAGDVMAILNDLGITKAHMVGHDWAPPSHGYSPPSRPATSTTSSPCRSATRSPSAAPSNSTRNPGTCCCPVPRHRRALAGRRQLGQLPALGAPPRRRPGDRRPGSGRFAHAGPELVPRQPAA
jgi:hypothetical protein